ncbi:UNVERIFIED_CONTAM: Major allergen Pru ar 1 [Sesamum angustifolium]|uniref:Major allergen Pru ar 1 n=1 Tax=Sesamum angustifolium TaxID=2727405 RepID=A0AAW2IQ22_9LAMI
MVSITYDVEIPSPIPATKMYKAVVLDSDTLIPKIMPQAIKNVEILEGDGSVGTVKLIHFGEGSQYKSVKHHVDALDTENLTHSYSIVEDGGCICKNRSIYHAKGGFELSEEKIKEGKEKAMAMFKAIEAYLQAKPEA